MTGKIIKLQTLWISGVLNGGFCITNRLNNSDGNENINVKNNEMYKLDQILLALNDLIYVFDEKGIYNYVSPAAANAIGLKPEDMIGRKSSEVGLDQESLNKFYPIQKSVFETGTPLTEEISIESSGKIYHFKCNLTLIPDFNSKPCVMARVRDITRQKMAENALIESEEIFRLAFENANTGMCLMDLKGNMTRVNPEMCNILGYTEEILESMNIADITHNEDLDLTDAFIRKSLNGGFESSTFEKRYYHREGHTVWGQVSSSLVRDVAGNPQYFISQLQDITARKRTEQKINQLATIVESSDEAIISATPQGKILSWNPAAEIMFGYSEEEVFGNSIFILTPPELREEFNNVLKRLLIGEEIEPIETVLMAKDGSKIELLLILSGIIDDSENVVGITTSMNNISQRKQVEEAERVNSVRMKAMLNLYEMTTSSIKEITDFALEQLVAITQSTIGYIAFLNKEEDVLTMYSWSSTAMKECKIETKPLVYPLENTGLWGEAVRQRRPIITNDYASPNLFKKGYPKGHVNLKRHMNVPIFDSGSIVVVAGVGNKATEYDANDVIQITILINFLWSIIKHKKANDILRGSLEEKEVLLREIHHRVKNNLQIISSLLNLQADTIENEEAKEALKESKNRVRSIAMIHGKLYRSKDLSKIDFSEYVKGLTSDILRTYTSSSNLISLNQDLGHFLLKIEIAMPLGLIINEMVTNSLKHAFKPGLKGEISIKLKSDGEMMILTVSDNGIGFPKDLDAKYTKTLGLRLLYSLVNQINGEIKLNKNNGTEFRITFREP